MAWVAELRSVAGDGKVRQANIYADDLAIVGNGRGGNSGFSQHGSKVFPGLISAHGDGLDSADNLTMHHSLDVPQLGQVQLAPIHNLHALRVLDGLLAVFRLEVWIFCAALKEVHECARHVQAHRLEYLTMRLSKPLVFFLEFRKAFVQSKLTKPLACFLIHLLRLCQAVIPQPPRTPECLGKRFFLLGCRVNANFGSC